MVHLCDRCDTECTGHFYTITVEHGSNLRVREWCDKCVTEVFG